MGTLRRVATVHQQWARLAAENASIRTPRRSKSFRRSSILINERNQEKQFPMLFAQQQAAALAAAQNQGAWDSGSKAALAGTAATYEQSAAFKARQSDFGEAGENMGAMSDAHAAGLQEMVAKDVFASADTDKNGTLSADELKAFLENPDNADKKELLIGDKNVADVSKSDFNDKEVDVKDFVIYYLKKCNE